MPNYTLSPNMDMPIPNVSQAPGPEWAQDLNSSLMITDAHDHTPGKGVQLTSASLNINGDLPFNSNNLTLVKTVRFSVQASPLAGSSPNLGALYIAGTAGDLYLNDLNGNQIQITAGGAVNATSSGISSGTASAAFSGGQLVVKSSATSGANVVMQSLILTNNANLTNQLSVVAPVLSGSYQLTLPLLPVTQSFLTLDATGNIAAYASISQGIQRTNLVAVGQQVSSSCGTFVSAGLSGDITNLTVTITTSGRPVMLMMQSDGGAASIESIGGGGFFNLTFVRGVTTLGQYEYQAASSVIFPASLTHLDVVGAGTYTYKMSYNAQVGVTFALLNSVLVAYEL